MGAVKDPLPMCQNEGLIDRGCAKSCMFCMMVPMNPPFWWTCPSEKDNYTSIGLGQQVGECGAAPTDCGANSIVGSSTSVLVWARVTQPSVTYFAAGAARTGVSKDIALSAERRSEDVYNKVERLSVEVKSAAKVGVNALSLAEDVSLERDLDAVVHLAEQAVKRAETAHALNGHNR